MEERGGFLGGAFDDCAVLWFIILFLLLFWQYGCGYDRYDSLDVPPDNSLNIN